MPSLSNSAEAFFSSFVSRIPEADDQLRCVLRLHTVCWFKRRRRGRVQQRQGERDEDAGNDLDRVHDDYLERKISFCTTA